MPRGRKKKTVENAVEQKLRDAVKFIRLAQHPGGSDNNRFCMMHNHNLIAFDSVIAVGAPIDEALSICPESSLLLAALEAAGPEFQIVQMPDNRLELTSGEFRVSIPCSTGNGLAWANPDPPQVLVENRALVDALKIAGELASDKAEKLVASVVSLADQTAVATNHSLIFEAFHGIELPKEFLLPKIAIKQLLKSKKMPVKLGWSDNTFTFWFEDNSWLRTNIYTETIQDMRKYMNGIWQSCESMLPTNLKQALIGIQPFCAGRVKIDGHTASATGTTTALSIPLDDYMPPRIYNIDNLLLAIPLIAKYEVTENSMLFMWESGRGAMYCDKIPAITLQDWENRVIADCEVCRNTNCCAGKPCCGNCIPF